MMYGVRSMPYIGPGFPAEVYLFNMSRVCNVNQFIYHSDRKVCQGTYSCLLKLQRFIQCHPTLLTPTNVIGVDKQQTSGRKESQ